ncbi:MAG TPA: hypothetical protein VEI07_26860, partial [Planctomycetaceae bacterium]|nr:hypothetical protein [Planctomycetaceae bacterium]
MAAERVDTAIGYAVFAIAFVILVLIVAWFVTRNRRRRSAAPDDLDRLLSETDQSRYKSGQVWSLREPAPSQARLTVLCVESFDAKATIVHVVVSGVPLPVGHMPFDERAIDESVLEQVDTATLGPEALEGYEEW